METFIYDVTSNQSNEAIATEELPRGKPVYYLKEGEWIFFKADEDMVLLKQVN